MSERPKTQLDGDMARLADGDRGAFAAVFQVLRPMLVPFCQRALGAGPDADDVAQIALEKIFERASEYDPTRPALPWAFAIASWECATVKRRRQRARVDAGASLDDAASPEESPEDQAIAKELAEALRHTLSALAPADRQTLELAFSNDGLESAATPAFRKRKERAIARLRNLWRRRDS
jgi:RNA polymerase sigma factor (sigma-70 family)